MMELPVTPGDGHSRRRRQTPKKWLAALTLLPGVVAVLASGCGAKDTTQTPDLSPPGTAAHGAEPEPTTWPVPSNVPERVTAAGLNLGPMGMAEHYHLQLRIIIRGTQTPVAPNIGVDPTTGAMSAVHTHDADGTIHVEATTKGEVFTLGQVFTQWGVPLTAQQVGPIRATDGEQVSVSNNGSPLQGDPNQVRLRPDQRLTVTLG